MATKIELGPEHAHVPDALTFFLLRPGKPLRYSWLTRLGDRWAGRMDRTDAPATTGGEPPVADTPWLKRLTSECGNIIASERVRTEALVAIIDRERAELTARLSRVEAVAAANQAELDRLAKDPPFSGDAVVGAGEQYSPAEERLQRRHRERARTVAALVDGVNSAKAEALQITSRLQILKQERHSHWVVLLERIRTLVEHYRRRIGTYVRAMEHRRGGITWQVPDLPHPAWAVAELGLGSPDTDPRKDS